MTETRNDDARALGRFTRTSKRDRSVPWITTNEDLDEAFLDDLEMNPSPSYFARFAMADHFRGRLKRAREASDADGKTIEWMGKAWLEETCKTKTLEKRVADLELEVQELKK